MTVKNKILCYVFSLMSFAMFAFTVFFSGNQELMQQGIFWFGISLISVLIPEIDKLKLKDFELEFKRSIKSMEDKIDDLQTNLEKTIKQIEISDSQLSEDEKKERLEEWGNFDARLKSLSEKDRNKTVIKNSLYYLSKHGLSVKEVKENLKSANYYNGNIDNNFQIDLIESIKRFQEDNQMEFIDGFFGQMTHQLLVEKLKDNK